MTRFCLSFSHSFFSTPCQTTKFLSLLAVKAMKALCHDRKDLADAAVEGLEEWASTAYFVRTGPRCSENGGEQEDLGERGSGFPVSSLWMVECWRLTELGISHLARGSRKLHTLNLSGCVRAVTPRSISLLKRNLPMLEVIAFFLVPSIFLHPLFAGVISRQQ